MQVECQVDHPPLRRQLLVQRQTLFKQMPEHPVDQIVLFHYRQKMRGRQHAPLWMGPARQYFRPDQTLPLKGDFGLVVRLELAIIQATLYVAWRL
ncbi:hypothetical protein D3C84_666860 [compost metagenome]